MDLYVATNKKTQTMHIGSLLCVDLVPRLQQGGIDIQVFDIDNLASLPPWLRGTPTLYVEGGVYAGHEAFSYLQSTALSASLAKQHHAAPSAAAHPQPPQQHHHAGPAPTPPVDAGPVGASEENEGGSNFNDGAFASMIPDDQDQTEPPKLSSDDFSRLTEARKQHTHPLASSGGAAPKPFEAEKD